MEGLVLCLLLYVNLHHNACIIARIFNRGKHMCNLYIGFSLEDMQVARVC